MTDDSEPCIHCILGKVLMDHLKDHPETHGITIAHGLGEIMRDILMSNGHQPKNASPLVVGPLLTAFMVGMGLDVGESRIEIADAISQTKH